MSMTEDEYTESVQQALVQDFEQQHGRAPGPDELDAVTGGVE